MIRARRDPAWAGYVSALTGIDNKKGAGPGVFSIDETTVDPYRWNGPPPPPTTTTSVSTKAARSARDACDGVGAALHPADKARRDKQKNKRKRSRAGAPPGLTVVFVTKRPGGYDVLLNSLRAQTSRDYELVCVDELARERGDAVRAAAAAAAVPLAAVTVGKPRSPSRPGRRRFGIANAINTGVLLARGAIITILMDNGWVPADFVERTLRFYSDPARAKSFLAYPERFFQHTGGAPLLLHDDTALSAWTDRPIDRPLSEDPRRFTPGFSRPDYLVEALLAHRKSGGGGGAGSRFPWRWLGRFVSPRGQKKIKKIESDSPVDDDDDGDARRRPGFVRQPLRDGSSFWEMSFSTSPRSAWEAVNGVEEWLDEGDDCHEANVRLRAELLGYDLWIDAGVMVENVWHQYGAFEESRLWRRYAKNSNMQAHAASLEKIRLGSRPLASENTFDMAAWFAHRCAERLPVAAVAAG